MQCHAEDIGHIVLLWLQDGQSRRTGGLDFSPDVTTLGLQALVRLYYSTPQQLGYVFPIAPTSFQLENGCVVLPKGRMAPVSHSNNVSSRATDVFDGSVDDKRVVIKTSSHISEEVGFCFITTAISIITSMVKWL